MNSDLYFPLAAEYRQVASDRGAVRESGARFRVFPYTERHLQCVWFDPALRPSDLLTHEGERVEVEDPGIWNLEPGPDFLGAVLRVGEGRRRVRGDVEVHIHPHDWRAHAHREDPRYAGVCAHVTYFSGALPSSELPSGALQIALRAPLAARAAFSFDAVDVAAYPYAARAQVPPCQRELSVWKVEAKQAVLDAAGQERLRRKSVRLALRIEECSVEQVLYEETLAVFGYKHNKLAFRALADCAPLAELRDRSMGDPLTAQAILMGVAGLLPDRVSPRWDAETRERVRAMWDRWFRHRERWANRAMSRDDWRTAGLRPVNHPARRIAAAAALFADGVERWSAVIAEAEARPARMLSGVTRYLQSARDSYWDRRLGWGGKPLASRVALVGQDRIHLFVTNVWIPLLAARGRAQPFSDSLLGQLEPEGDNQLIRQTANNLFGPHHPASWYRTGVRRQGLIQIFHDYCLNDRSRCASCSFPTILKAWREKMR